jgi:hypothetical protein
LPWIYQRIHADPTPIDIAFIGTSRTGLSVHSRRLQEDLARRDVHVHAVNLHVIRTGRNLHFAIAKELLEYRPVKLVVLEINEWEDRKPHPDFANIADCSDILFAPLFINLGYLSDLVRLPGRQFNLFVDTLLQDSKLASPPSAAEQYAGPNLDHAEYIDTLDGRRHYNSSVHSRAEMEELRLRQDAEVTPALLPRSLDWLEYRLPRYYVEQILQLTAAHGVKLALLYVPRYGGPAEPPPYARLYAGRAPLLNPWPVLQNHRLWTDATHLNWDGAKLLTDELADQLVTRGFVEPGQRDEDESINAATSSEAEPIQRSPTSTPEHMP